MTLTDTQRKAIHDLALNARDLLTQDAREHLEGVYGLYADGRLDPPERLPHVQQNPDDAETYYRLVQFLDDEARAGLPRPEAVEKLVKEIAFTHLNRFVAFKMMETRKLIRGTLDKGTNSNGFKFYLAEHPADYERFQAGEMDSAYRHFLWWQAGQVARELTVLFDPETLPSRVFPRPRAVLVLVGWLNAPDMEPCWLAEETIGWVYQFFNEPELQAAFAKVRLTGAKFEAKDVPSATQLFTPNWIVRFLVQNTLGRIWVQMHPDTRLLHTELLDYLVPVQGAIPAEPLRPVREITLLDPACGTMHFGLVAFDLFAAMYQEEWERAGEAGWLETPSVSDPAAIAATIIERNLYGIDIDLRAVQLSALALYLKAKALNKQAVITESHLACADVLPLNGARLGTFLREMQFSPLIERLIKTLWERLKDVNQFGSLLRLEREINTLLDESRERPMLARMEADFAGDTPLWGDEFWDLLIEQVIQGLDEFARQQAQAGADMRFFKGEAVKGLRLLHVMLGRYDVVVTNPPYLSRRKMNKDLAGFLDDQYPEAKNDMYAAFIARALELTHETGMVGMLTMHSFMFISSYEVTRRYIREQAAIISMAHSGPGTFEFGNPGTLQTTTFALRKISDPQQRENTAGTYIRLVNAPVGDGKREGLAHALATGANSHHVAQRLFDAIPGAPWAYWISDKIRELFLTLPKLEDVAQPKVGLQTGDNARFLRYWWEVSSAGIGFRCRSRAEAEATGKRWFPYMKGGEYRKWYGNQEHVVNWYKDGEEMLAFRPFAVIRNPDYYFREGVTYSYLTSGNFSVRLMDVGFVFDVAGSSIFAQNSQGNIAVLSLLNAQFSRYVLRLLNPTVNFQVGDLKRVIVNLEVEKFVSELVAQCLSLTINDVSILETSNNFIAPLAWHTGLDDATQAQARLADLERQIDDEVYQLYGLAGEDRAAIEAELAGGVLTESDDEASPDAPVEVEEAAVEAPLTEQELAVRWISYAVGVVMGRFQPGVACALGRAVYQRGDFAVGSLPAPDEAEFDWLVGGVERFAYVDAEGGRHLFSAAVEQALVALAVPDGITVLDEGHPRDLPRLVEQALVLMLGDAATDAVISAGAGASNDLRTFLSKDFFTDWHFRWYRKRPVYWPLQSAKRSYGFVLFHERMGKYTLYSLLRDYWDYRLNRQNNRLEDIAARRPHLAGRELKQLEREIAAIEVERDELKVFGIRMEQIANEGYLPDPDWIDDGVILRLAPLWELIPIWKAEPKKHWEKLVAGDFDWSHIAMAYWPERVREKCRTNKSFAIAHGHEDWFEA